MNEIIILGFIGILAGIMSSLFGIGGGIIMVPAMIFVLNYSLIQANGTSLAALMMPVGIFAVLTYYKKGYLDIKIASIFAMGLLFGVYFGAKLAIILSTNILKPLYGIFLLWISWKFFDGTKIVKKRLNILHQSNDNKINNTSIYIVISIALFTGIISGLFGIGGGLIMVPFMISILKFEYKKAVGTSLAALLLPVALPGVITYYNSGLINITSSLILASGIIIGTLFGMKISLTISNEKIKRIYAIFLIIIALQFIISSY